ncbi:MAG: hypothetical protein OEX97_13605, partial [Acidimicrobiia bacterium]|nr:hypothetical protein [Acidimicrobiia bacterium]
MRSIEATMASVGGAALGWLVGLPLGWAVPAAIVACVNGAVSGWRGIYPWRTTAGWIGFLLDSTWGLVGTTGSILFHVVQIVMPSGKYRSDLSRRRGRHVYAGGYRLKP